MPLSVPGDEGRMLSGLLELSRLLLAARTLAEVEQTLTDCLQRVMGAGYAVYARYEESLDALRITALTGLSWTPSDFRLLRGEGLNWQAAQERRVLLVGSTQIPTTAVRPVEGTPDMSLLYAPLFSMRGDLLGVLSLGRPAPEFTPRDVTLLETYAQTATIAVERALQSQRLAEIREGTMLALGLALEARDYETHGHTSRTVRLATRLGTAMRLTDAQIDDLRQGAYLHDIGKLSISVEVLLKAAALNEHERELIERHTVMGEALVRRVPTIARGALAVIRSHHERWDGLGYPDHLRGEDIPLLARVFAVVDVYDALTNTRPYRPALPVQEAVQIIEAQANQHFDPEVVEAFVPLVEAEAHD